MKTVAFAGTKGGVGKTKLAFNIACPALMHEVICGGIGVQCLLRCRYCASGGLVRIQVRQAFKNVHECSRMFRIAPLMPVCPLFEYRGSIADKGFN